jgi:hypothetical protein
MRDRNRKHSLSGSLIAKPIRVNNEAIRSPSVWEYEELPLNDMNTRRRCAISRSARDFPQREHPTTAAGDTR